MGEIKEMIANKVVNLEMLIELTFGAVAEAESPHFWVFGMG